MKSSPTYRAVAHPQTQVLARSEVVGLLVLIAILASLLIPQVAIAISSARVSGAAGFYQTNPAAEALTSGAINLGSAVLGEAPVTMPVVGDNHTGKNAVSLKCLVDELAAPDAGDGLVWLDGTLTSTTTANASLFNGHAPSGAATQFNFGTGH